MKKVIVTGATGFIGKNLVPMLHQLGCKLVLLTRDKKRCKKLFNTIPIEIIEWDINDGAPPIILNNPTTLLHLAWEGLPNYESLHHIEKNFVTNYRFINELLDAGVTSLVVAGTCMEYGLKSGCLEVNDICDPVTPYGFAKHTLHKSLLFLQRKKKFNLAWARIFYTIGIGQSRNSIIPQLDEAIDRGDSQFNMTKGEQLLDYLPITKVSNHLITLVVQQSNGTYNVCSGNPISVRELVERRVTERKSTIALNLGHYPPNNYSPKSFWGKPNVPARNKFSD